MRKCFVYRDVCFLRPALWPNGIAIPHFLVLKSRESRIQEARFVSSITLYGFKAILSQGFVELATGAQQTSFFHLYLAGVENRSLLK